MPELKITNDIALDIAVGRSRKERSWKNKEILWSDLVNRLSETHRTAETHAEYLACKKGRQDEIKDIGGFVGGYLAGGKRKAGSVTHRQILTLDLDFAPADVWAEFTLFFSCAAVLYSTHKHSPEKPRYRLVIPLDRPVFADEYEPIARKVAEMVGIDYFDDTTYQAERLMYWPSTAKDAQYVFEFQDGDWLNADDILSSYHDWKDSSSWPVSDRAHDVIKRAIKKQEDPVEKPGIVGAFCRSFSIDDAIRHFLPDVYEACDIDGRYTYKEGSTTAGLVVYDDKFAYSHHGTDPTSGKLCNAFDLVRIHKYQDLDENIKDGTPGNKTPSYAAMAELAAKDPEVRALIISEKTGAAVSDFEAVEIEDEDWIKKLSVDKRGNVLNGLDNVVTILLNDTQLKNRIIFDEFDQRETAIKDLPWRKVEGDRYLKDGDISNLKHFMKIKYGFAATTVTVEDALKVVFEVNKTNSVKLYLDSLKWDGKHRIDRLFIDYLGAEDNEYSRAVTRKTIIAAVARIFRPGTKFDYMLTLIGKQGIGKSTIIAKLGGQWFTDSFSFQMLDKGNKAYEQLQGAWLVEAGELTGLRKADVEAAKAFLTSKEDRYRVSYGRRLSFFPRKCVFFGTTNNNIFLRDQTGNRRFWPLNTGETEPVRNIWEELTEAEINQIWAEAVQVYKYDKEKLFLPPELEKYAEALRSGHTETDDRKGVIEHYLNTPVPTNWDDMSIYQRRAFLHQSDNDDDDELTAIGTVLRDKICAAEIWCELLGGKVETMTGHNTKFIHDIMGNMEGWRKDGNPKTFKRYGRQRAYIRLNVTKNKCNAGATQKNKRCNARNASATQN